MLHPIAAGLRHVEQAFLHRLTCLKNREYRVTPTPLCSQFLSKDLLHRPYFHPVVNRVSLATRFNFENLFWEDVSSLALAIDFDSSFKYPSLRSLTILLPDITAC